MTPELEFMGIYVRGAGLTVTGSGVITVTAGESGGISTAIRADSVTLESGYLTASGKTGLYSAGVHATYGVTVNGGTLTAWGGDAAYSWGVRCGYMTVNGGTVKLSGGTLAADRSPDLSEYNDPYVEVNTADSAEGAEDWNGSDALGGAGSAFRYVGIEPNAYRYPVVEAALDYGTVGEEYWDSIDAKYGSGGYTFKVEGLPDGLTFDEAYKNVYGIPEKSGRFSVTVTVTDDKGRTDSKTVELVIAPAGGLFTVTYDTMGGTAVPSVKVKVGEQAPEPSPAPVKSGCIFIGWCADKACSEPYSFAMPVTENVTLYAKWEIVVSVTGEISGNKVSYKVTGAPTGARLAAARYDGDKMTAVKLVSPVPDKGSVTLKGSGKVFKLMLLDSKNKPICAAWTGTAG